MDLTPGADVTRELGDTIRAARRERGLSQQELAELVGVHRTYLSARWSTVSGPCASNV